MKVTGSTVTRVLSIIEANFPGQFYADLKTGEYFGWTEYSDGEKRGCESPEDLILATSNETLHIMPKLGGASSNKGGVMAILGVVLIGVAIVASGGTATIGLKGLADTPAAGGLWSSAAQLGIGKPISGIGAMLSPMPSLNLDSDSNEQHQSYVLSGPVNTMSKGGAIPVLYGDPIVGSTVISAGIDIEQMSLEE